MTLFGSRPFGDILRGFREREHMSQQDLAQQLGLHRNTIGGWERGNNLTNKTSLHELARVLHLNREEQETLFEACGLFLSSSLWNIPFPRNPYFTAREKSLQHLYDVLLTNKQRGLTYAISGLGGIGKTQVALEYCYRFREHYRAIFWLQADSSEVLYTGLAQLAHSLRLIEESVHDHNLVAAAVQHWLRDQTEWLLVFDNVDDLPLITRHLPPSHHGIVLFTTRTQVTEPIAPSLRIENMREEEGAHFLLRRAKILDLMAPLNQLHPAVLDPAREIVRIMDGLPLALDQAGAYICETACDLVGYLDRYSQRRSDLLKRRGHLIFDHPEAVTTTWQLSFEKLTRHAPMAAQLLQVCAFLHPDNIAETLFLEGATDLCITSQNESLDLLTFDAAILELRKFSFLRRHSETRTLSLHRLVQIVLLEWMGTSIQEQWVKRILVCFNRLFPDVSGVFYQTIFSWPRCHQLFPHVQKCLDHARHLQIVSSDITQLSHKVESYLSERAQYAQASAKVLYTIGLATGLEELEQTGIDESMANISIAFFYQGNFVQVEHYFQSLLQTQKYQLGSQHPLVAQILNALGWTNIELGQYIEAEEFFKQAHTIHQQSLPSDHPEYIHTILGLATCDMEQRKTGKYPQAEVSLVQATVVLEHAFGSLHPMIAGVLCRLAMLCKIQQQYGRAEEYMRRALRVCLETLGPDHPTQTFLLTHMGLICIKLKYMDQAEVYASQAVTIAQQVMSPDHLWAALSWEALADVYDAQKQTMKAIPFYQRALGIYEKTLRPNHLWIANVQEKLRCLDK